MFQMSQEGKYICQAVLASSCEGPRPRPTNSPDRSTSKSSKLKVPSIRVQETKQLVDLTLGQFQGRRLKRGAVAEHVL